MTKKQLLKQKQVIDSAILIAGICMVVGMFVLLGNLVMWPFKEHGMIGVLCNNAGIIIAGILVILTICVAQGRVVQTFSFKIEFEDNLQARIPKARYEQDGLSVLIHTVEGYVRGKDQSKTFRQTPGNIPDLFYVVTMRGGKLYFPPTKTCSMIRNDIAKKLANSLDMDINPSDVYVDLCITRQNDSRVYYLNEAKPGRIDGLY